MKVLLVLLLLALPLLTGAAPLPTEVVLTARDVVSAIDIEAAIQAATNYGTRPGVVTLDARYGPFIYDHPDKSINIFYSDVTLRSLNGATFTNCDDGVFFDDFPLHDIVVRGITFRCTGGGVAIPMIFNECRGVTIQGNTFEVQAVGVSVSLGSDVTIVRNVVSGGDPIVLYDSTGVRIAGNDLHGNVSVLLNNSDGNQVTGNYIGATDVGVMLRMGSDGNKVNANRISGVQTAGIALEEGNSGNHVHANKVACAACAACVAVVATQDGWEQNRISGNQLVR
jgi:nitrous oxidase accessory protein NosD